MKFVQVLFCLLFSGMLIGQNYVNKEILKLKSEGKAFKSYTLLEYESSDRTDFDISSSSLTKADFYQLNVDEVRRLKADHPSEILLNILNGEGQSMVLELTAFKPLADGFALIKSSEPGVVQDYSPALHYRGVVSNESGSLVALSIFNEELMGFIATTEGNFTLAKLENARGLSHILYNDKDLVGQPDWDCETMDDGGSYTDDQLKYDPNKSPGDCIAIYIEIDDDIVSAKGGAVPATNYIEGLFGQSSVLYANDGITTVISEILAWDTPAPYSGSSSSAMLSSYQSNTGTFNGDLSHLVSYQASGGIAAGFSGICNSNPDLSKCFSSIDGSYANVPTYSWSVMVVTHEMGHLIGSRHTHACVWNGNNTAIDGCSGSTEGGCPLPGYPSGGGTLMSYCHLQSVGINFNLGFGPQPTAVLQNTVNSAGCLAACGGPTCYNGVQDGDETGVDCGGSSCPACPTCNDGIQNGDETGVDCGGSSCPPCPPSYCNSNGQNQSYEYVQRVQLGSIDNNSGNNGGYADFTGQSTTLTSGSNYSITLTPGFAGGAYSENWSVWIDYNADYDFDDAGELVAQGASSGAINLNISVASLSSSVSTRMRVSMKYGGYSSPCESFTYGEVEDYTVDVDVPSGPTCNDGIQNGDETGVDCGGSSCPACPTCSDGIQNGDETGVDCGGSSCPACPTCNDGIQNGDETGVDCGGSNCPACPTCSDGVQNGDETGVDCGGSVCPPCTSCNDGIQNGDETGVDCGGSSCPACPTCTDGVQNGEETGVDCGGSSCPACPTCSDGVQNGDETGVDCGGSSCPACPTCNDGIQNGDETGVDCGGTSCPPCGGGGCTYELINFNNFESGWGIWNDGGSDCRRSANDSPYAYSGVRPVRLRDNTSTSTTTTDDLNLSGYDELTVNFTYLGRSMENGEDFWLQVSTNGGSSYSTFESWARGTDFENDVREFESVVVPGPFSTNTRLRFRCDASGNSDWVYIDDVEILGCNSGTALTNPDEEVAEEGVLADVEQIQDLTIYPNPTYNNLNMKFRTPSESAVQVSIFDMAGNQLNSFNINAISGWNEHAIDVNTFNEGMYVIRITSDHQRIIKKFFVVK